MYKKSIAITAVLVAVAMLAGIVATTPITTVYADESETENNEKCGVDKVLASGESGVSIAVECVIGPD